MCTTVVRNQCVCTLNSVCAMVLPEVKLEPVETSHAAAVDALFPNGLGRGHVQLCRSVRAVGVLRWSTDVTTLVSTDKWYLWERF